MYVLVMGIYRAHLSHRLRGLVLVLSLPFVVIGFLMDVFANLTIASLVFLEPPREWLVTSRLQRYIAHGTGWRAAKARWICDNLLDVFDPSGDHC
jgi:hypothetical protein